MVHLLQLTAMSWWPQLQLTTISLRHWVLSGTSSRVTIICNPSSVDTVNYYFVCVTVLSHFIIITTFWMCTYINVFKSELSSCFCLVKLLYVVSILYRKPIIYHLLIASCHLLCIFIITSTIVTSAITVLFCLAFVCHMHEIIIILLLLIFLFFVPFLCFIIIPCHNWVSNFTLTAGQLLLIIISSGINYY